MGVFAQILVAAFLLAGCGSMPQRLAPPEPGSYQEIGKGACSKCGFLLFDVIPIGFRSAPNRAYRCAVESQAGDGLINPTIRTKWFYGVVGVGFCTEVSGTVVRRK